MASLRSRATTSLSSLVRVPTFGLGMMVQVDAHSRRCAEGWLLGTGVADTKASHGNKATKTPCQRLDAGATSVIVESWAESVKMHSPIRDRPCRTDAGMVVR